jgi:hypothetical protein
MRSLLAVAAELDQWLTQQGWPYCFIGGLALQRWGQPRVTVDVDVTVLCEFGQEGRYASELLSRYKGRLPDALDFALKNRVLLLESLDGIGIDVAFGAIPYEHEVVQRATRYEFLKGLSLLTCSAEDLIVLKAFADRSRDWADIETVIQRQGDRLDWGYIDRQLPLLCDLKGAPEIVDHLKRLREEL